MADDEFAEFDTDEATFDAMMREAEPAELVAHRLVTVRSAANDIVTFASGLPVSVSGPATLTTPLPAERHEGAQVLRRELVRAKVAS